MSDNRNELNENELENVSGGASFTGGGEEGGRDFDMTGEDMNDGGVDPHHDHDPHHDMPEDGHRDEGNPHDHEGSGRGLA